jgi:hypothetical protein
MPEDEIENEKKPKKLLFLLSLCLLIQKPSGAFPKKRLKEKEVLLLRLISLRSQRPFQKGSENFPSGVEKRICLRCWRRSTERLHLQG